MSSLTPSFVAEFGIDGARAGWVVAALGAAPDAAPGSDRPRLWLVPRLADLAPDIARAGALVDIPVGLPGGPHAVRRCDGLARRLLGPRRSSVFPAPARATLACDDWDAANAANRGATGRGLPRQSWGLVPKIRDVDTLLRDRAELRGRLRESHPELAFAWLAGGSPMARPKSHPDGSAARWHALERLWPGVRAASSDWVDDHAGVGLDDAADALALLALARAGAVPLPAEPETDEDAVPMEILVHPSLITEADP